MLASFKRDSASREHEIETIGNIIPTGQIGCVLVTSRDRFAIAQLVTSGEELLAIDEDEAKKILVQCSRANLMESEDAEVLERELGSLPLAIKQPGGFIRENGVTISEYRHLYNANESVSYLET